MTDRPDALDSLSFEPLTPTSFLDRAAAAHGDRVGVVDGDSSWTYAELHERCTRMAGVLAPRGERQAGGRAGTEHARDVGGQLRRAVGGCAVGGGEHPPLGRRGRLHPHALECRGAGARSVIRRAGRPGRRPARRRAAPDPGRAASTRSCWPRRPAGIAPDRRAVAAVDQLHVGTTGRPKGVMYHHRGAYLQALAMVGPHRADADVGAPVDAADVPLQRLVLPVGGHRGRGDARLPAEGGSGARSGA